MLKQTGTAACHDIENREKENKENKYLIKANEVVILFNNLADSKIRYEVSQLLVIRQNVPHSIKTCVNFNFGPNSPRIPPKLLYLDTYTIPM